MIHKYMVCPGQIMIRVKAERKTTLIKQIAWESLKAKEKQTKRYYFSYSAINMLLFQPEALTNPNTCLYFPSVLLSIRLLYLNMLQ